MQGQITKELSAHTAGLEAGLHFAYHLQVAKQQDSNNRLVRV